MVGDFSSSFPFVHLYEQGRDTILYQSYLKEYTTHNSNVYTQHCINHILKEYTTHYYYYYDTNIIYVTCSLRKPQTSSLVTGVISYCSRYIYKKHVRE